MAGVINYIGLDGDMVYVDIWNNKCAQLAKNNGRTYREIDSIYAIDDKNNIYYFNDDKHLLKTSIGEAIMHIVSFQHIFFVLYESGDLYRFTRLKQKCTTEQLICTNIKSIAGHNMTLYCATSDGDILDVSNIIKSNSENVVLTQQINASFKIKKLVRTELSLSWAAHSVILGLAYDGNLWCYSTYDAYFSIFGEPPTCGENNNLGWRHPKDYFGLVNVYCGSNLIFLLCEDGKFLVKKPFRFGSDYSAKQIDLGVVEMVTYPVPITLTTDNHIHILFDRTFGSDLVFEKQNLPLCAHLDLESKQQKRLRNTKCAS